LTINLTQLIPLAINASMGLIVLALGLHASLEDATSVLRRPALLARSLLAMNVIMPVLAVIGAALLDLHPAIEITLVALAVSPVPPILPRKQTQAGGTPSYVVGLLVTAAALAIVLAPGTVEILDRVFGKVVHVQPGEIASLVLVSVIVPLASGLVIRHFAPRFAERIARPVSLLATVLLALAFLPVLVRTWPDLRSMVGNGTLLVLALFSLAGIAVGHLLGGPHPDDRTVLALATGTRHPGVALAIAGATPVEQRAVLAVVLWHLIVGAIVSVPYVHRRKREHEGPA
jgi:bile acid:Na+ symporter, BASS family